MKYSTPELVVLGSAAVLVLGDVDGHFDNGMIGVTRASLGVALGLDE